MKKIFRGVFPIVLLLALRPAFAQEIPEQLQERIGASRYFLGKEDELLIPVNILGYVNKPGQFMVPNGTDLISLIAYAGGFREDAKINNIKIVRGMSADGQPNILRINLKKYFESGQRALIPRMMPDDTIIVSGSRSVTLRNVLDFVARLAVVAQIYFYLQVATR
jgi:NADH:ubiquinone oxidoreductase subunit F (NADH-binding)